MGSIDEDKLEILSEELFEFALIHHRIGDNFFVSVEDVQTNEVIFYHKCDTFTSGNLVYHLIKALQKFEVSHNTIVLSRWCPSVHARFMCNLDEDVYISTKIFRDKDKGADMVRFRVKLPSEKYGDNKLVDFYCTFYGLRRLLLDY